MTPPSPKRAALLQPVRHLFAEEAEDKELANGHAGLGNRFDALSRLVALAQWLAGTPPCARRQVALI
jgi:hypothetical protein